MKTTLIASTLLVLSSLGLQAPEAFSKSHQNVARQTQPTTLRAQRIKRPSVRPGLGRPDKIQAPLSVVGQWSGGMHSKGDDVVAHFEVNIPAGPGVIKQGTWTLLAPNAQGTATMQKQGNQVKIKFLNYYGKTVELQGTFKNGGQTISGFDVNNPNFVFSFSR